MPISQQIQAEELSDLSAALRLAANKDKILQEWQRKLIEHSAVAARLTPADLYGSLAKFLDELIWALRPDTADEITSLAVCAEHGEQRARLPGYTLTGVLFEYSLLRKLIYEHLQAHAPLTAREQAVILNSFDLGLAQAVEKFAQAQDLMRRQFIAVLSHDMRNPLAAAWQCAELMLSGQDASKHSALLAGKVLANLRRVDRMISDILDVSRLSFGQLPTFKREPCDLKEIALQVTADLATQCGDRFQVDSTGQTVGHWSADGLYRVLENLLLNAVKYGYTNTPIRVEIHGQERDVRVSVINYGDPLTADELTQLGTLGFRSSSALAGGVKGWGLGLTMVQGMVTAHGGKLQITRANEHQTVFTVLLPLHDESK